MNDTAMLLLVSSGPLIFLGIALLTMGFDRRARVIGAGLLLVFGSLFVIGMVLDTRVIEGTDNG